MAGDKLMRRVAIVMFTPAFGEHVFLLGFQHWEFANLGEVMRETGFSIENRQGSCTGHIAPSIVQAPDSGEPGRPPLYKSRGRCNVPPRTILSADATYTLWARKGKNKTWSRTCDPC